METKNNPKLDSIIRKLRKLQALYEGAKAINSEAEANTAAAAITRILTEYNLTLDEIGKEEKIDDPVGRETVSGYSFKSIGGRWEYRLYFVLCKYNFCRAYYSGKGFSRVTLIGKKENVELVKWLKETLSRYFVELSKKRYQEFKDSDNFIINPQGRDTFQRHYLMGCTFGVEEKLKEAKSEHNAEYTAKLNALMVRSDEALDKFVAENIGHIHTVRNSITPGMAFKEGKKDGRNANINRPLQESHDRQVSRVNLLG